MILRCFTSFTYCPSFSPFGRARNDDELRLFFVSHPLHTYVLLQSVQDPIELCFGHYKSSLSRASPLKFLELFTNTAGFPSATIFHLRKKIREETALEDSLDTVTQCGAVAVVVLMKRKNMNSEDRRLGQMVKARRMLSLGDGDRDSDGDSESRLFTTRNQYW